MKFAIIGLIILITMFAHSKAMQNFKNKRLKINENSSDSIARGKALKDTIRAGQIVIAIVLLGIVSLLCVCIFI